MADGSSSSSSTAGDNNGDSGASSNWWGSWVSSAKAKSSSVLEAVRKDLDELSTAVRTEVSNAGTVIGDTFKIDEPTVGQVKKSISTFFGQVTEALIPSLDDDQDQVEAVLITTDGQITLTGFQKHLAELQAADETYMTAPAASLTENYDRWLAITEQDQFTQNRLAKHLTSSEILNEKYLTLVPDQVSHMDFWQRYLFRRALLEDALANAELAERRARAEAAATGATAAPVTSPTSAKRLVQTEQPKTVLSTVLGGVEAAGDVEEGVEEASAAAEANAAVTDASDAAALTLDEADQLEAAFAAVGGGRDRSDATPQWPEETDFASVEISEEEQERLLRAYEQEIQEREMKRSQCVPLEEKLRLEKQQQQQPSKVTAGVAPKSARTSGNTKKTQQTTTPTPTTKSSASTNKTPSTKSTTKASKNSTDKKAQTQRNAAAAVAAKSTPPNKANASLPATANSAAVPATTASTTTVRPADSTKNESSSPASSPSTSPHRAAKTTKDDDNGSDGSWVKDFDLDDSK